MNLKRSLKKARRYFRKERQKESFKTAVPAICPPKNDLSDVKLGHIAFYSANNAGDAVLPRSVRDSFEQSISPHWQGFHAHQPIDQDDINIINRLNHLIIGGGGLFLSDTNPNNLSGWQWQCSLEKLKKIEVPISIFAVGYNRFRDQKEFSPRFTDHLNILFDKCRFFGLRNHGSIRAVSNYLPESRHTDIKYQPCPTTIISRLYPELFTHREELPEKPIIALNCAFDRSSRRMGSEKPRVLKEITKAYRELSRKYEIRYYSHRKDDEEILPLFDEAGIPYKLIKLYGLHPKDIIGEYSKPALVIGMRGHAQMIPFGCRVPILSLISHDKLAWFLEDLDQPQWGIEISEKDLGDQLIQKAIKMVENREGIIQTIDSRQETMMAATLENTRFILGID